MSRWAESSAEYIIGMDSWGEISNEYRFVEIKIKASGETKEYIYELRMYLIYTELDS